MTSLPSVAVVILNWNGQSYLKKFLPSVLASDYENLKIIVADNGSTDDSIFFLQQYFPSVKVLINEDNEGFAKGYNTALKSVTADYYVILNSDVAVEKNWIAPIILLMETDEKIAACQPKILSYKNKKSFEYAGASGGWIDVLGYPFNRGRVFEYCETDEGQYNTATEIFWASGAALFIRASVFNNLGGFDEYFFAHQEEIDLCWRIKRSGYKIYVEPTSIVYHLGGGTLPMGDPKKVYLNFRNNLVMLYKNLPFFELLWKIPLRILLDIVAAFQSLPQGKFSTFDSIGHAHLSFFKWIFLGKRGANIQKIRMKKLTGVYKGSIVWQFFIRKKKTFSEIVDINK
ncbi:MAG: glycosyltransferase family 2 protein [Ginsengibacter sp.]